MMSFELLLLIAAAGFVQTSAPDRWLPISVLGWQRRAPLHQVLILLVAMLAVHAALGLFVAELILAMLPQALELRLTAVAAVSLVGLSLLARMLRFQAARSSFIAGQNGGYGLWTVAKLMGASEIMALLWLRGHSKGYDVALTFMAFVLGSAVAGVLYAWWTRKRLMTPGWLLGSLSRLNPRHAWLSAAGIFVFALATARI